MNGFGFGFSAAHGTLLNQTPDAPIIPDGTPTDVSNVTDTSFDVISSVATEVETVVTLEYGTATGVYTGEVTADESPVSGTGDVNFSLTGLTDYTDYYCRVKAVSDSGTAYSAEFVQKTLFNATLASTGNGSGVSTLVLSVSENITLTITSGNARFYTDSGGTLGESTTWNVTTGALRTIYIKAPSGTSVLNISNPLAITGIGNSGNVGWVSGTNASKLSIDVSKTSITQARITGICALSGGFKNTTTYILCNGDFIEWAYSGAMPTSLTSIYLNSVSMNLTTLDFTGSGNISSFSLLNYRQTKMSSADMVTLLTSLTNRAGSLPNTLTINDYADYASPPTSVTNAVAALKAAKPNITTVNLGA